jgi:hypothetical protein
LPERLKFQNSSNHCVRGVETRTYHSLLAFGILRPDEVEKRQEGLGSDVYKISPTIAVKHGTRVQFREAQNMLFVKQNTTIPVPKVYAVYSFQIPEKLYPEGDAGTKDHINRTYIFMDFVAGATVEDSRDGWDEATMINVQNELKDCIGQLRGISRGDYIGCLDRGPVSDCMLKYHNDDRGMMNDALFLSRFPANASIDGSF